MTPAQGQRVRELFEAAVDAEPKDLHLWLQAETDDAEVRAEVESLLRNHSPAASFMNPPLAESGPALPREEGTADSALAAGTVIGQYTVVRELGRGAMGRV